ncbi:uncharacterized protein ccdc142 isoform X1 [Hypanus sabinus]|uniref:uncharacterized protein ccdc142 isoform X1 n=1 Tax=Hypanus sabinus TaxID=79690 RepID=UPI0028C4C753|nr:uncharacterized protein ccdc142 isoform X1 [Hypanus sabinus]
MSQTSGGFLLPLGSLLGQKRVSPAEAECKETESSDELSFPTTLEMPAASPFENKNIIVTGANKQTYTSFKSLPPRPPKDLSQREESLQKDKLDHLNGSGPQNSFAKSLQQSETFLWNRLQPGWKWLMAKHQGEVCFKADSDDQLLASDFDSRRSSGRMLEVEQIVFELEKCCQLQQSKGTLFHGLVKTLPVDILGTTDFQYHQVISNLGNNYVKLRKLLEHRSCILLNEAYVKNLRGASNFIRKLEHLLMQEKSKAVNVNISHSNVTSLKELGQLCEELRCHTNHWKSLEEKIKNDPWLNCKLLHLKKNFISMKKTLTLLSINALFVMERYISKVLRTLAYADPYSIASGSLQEFFRGLEIYNVIVLESKIPQLQFELNNSIEEININEFDLFSQRLKGTLCKQDGIWKIEPFLIERILNILANERGRIAAFCFYDAIMMNKKFLSIVNHHNLTALDWENIKFSFLRFPGSHDIFCAEEIKNTLCQPELGSSQQELKSRSCKKSIQKFCMEDEVFLNKIINALYASNIFWQHVLNRPKTGKLQETRAEELQLQRTIFSGENNSHQNLKNNQYNEITGDPLLSSLMRKSVRWEDYTYCEGKILLFSKYTAILWKSFATHLSDQFYFLPLFASGGSKHNIGKLDQCKAEISALLIQVLYEACYKGLLPSDCEPFVKDLCVSMWSRIALIHWDQVFCSTLGSILKDKCFPDPETKGATQRSRTAGLFLALFHPLCITLTWLMEQAQNQGSSNGAVCKLVVPSILVRTLSHCITTLQTSSHWLMTKGFQFLSSWSMNQFLLLTQGDLKILEVMTSKMLQLAETFCVEENHIQGIHQSLLQAEVKSLVKELGCAAAIFSTFSVKALTVFSTKCRKMALEIFEQTMPVGRQWRVNYRSVVLPSKSNEYATAAVHAIFGQVLEGIHQLPEDAQIIPLTEALTAFVEAWMDHILKEKIKFSVQGALQLKQDFDAIKELICSDEQRLSMEVRQAVLSLRVFHQVDNAIICLLQQPTRKVYVPSDTWDRFRSCCSSSSRTVDFSHQNLNSLDSLDLRSERTRAAFQSEASDQLSKIITTGHPESYLAVNQQEWLALRVNSSRRRKILRLPCMKNTPE